MNRFNANLILILGLSYAFLNADPAIVIKLNHPPVAVVESINKDILEILIKKFNDRTPGVISAKLIKAQLLDMGIEPQTSGIPVVYNGYSSSTNEDGLVWFPIRHTPYDTLHIVITPEI